MLMKTLAEATDFYSLKFGEGVFFFLPVAI